MADGGNRYIVLLDAMTEEKGLDDVLCRCVIGVKLSGEFHKFCERKNLLTVRELVERDLGEEVAELHELGKAASVPLPQRIHWTVVTFRRLRCLHGGNERSGGRGDGRDVGVLQVRKLRSHGRSKQRGLRGRKHGKKRRHLSVRELGQRLAFRLGHGDCSLLRIDG